MAKPGGESVPATMRPTFEAVVAITDAFCQKHLNAEYAAMCRKAAAALCRKRPSPLLSGNLNTWAAGIAHAVGSLNFLFDKTQTPHMSAGDLARAFGLSPNTVSQKARSVRRALNIRFLDWHWALPSKVDNYPGAWSIMVDGFVLDARTMPRPIQEEAFRKGLIPYVPGDKKTR